MRQTLGQKKTLLADITADNDAPSGGVGLAMSDFGSGMRVDLYAIVATVSSGGSGILTLHGMIGGGWTRLGGLYGGLAIAGPLSHNEVGQNLGYLERLYVRATSVSGTVGVVIYEVLSKGD